MASKHFYEWWRPDALLPALIVVGPYYFNKLVYVYFPGYPVFVAVDYACRTFGLAFLYLLCAASRLRYLYLGVLPYRVQKNF
jgi:hypothetical protein